MKYFLKHKLRKYIIAIPLLAIVMLGGFYTLTARHSVFADNASQFTLNPDPNAAQYGCGSNDPNGGTQGLIKTSIDLGCQGNASVKASPTDGYCNSYHNGITDMVFAIIRLLSAGVGILVVASVIVGGIQFSMSRSDPQASANAINRVRTSIIALIIYIFAYAILNFVVPGGFLQ